MATATRISSTTTKRRSNPVQVPSAAVLKRISLFSFLSDAELAEIAGLFHQKRVAKDEYIFLEGDPPERLYILLRGRVKLIKHSEDGKDVILHLVSPGEWFGSVAAFGRRPHPFSAQALEPSLALEVAGRDFAALMDRYPPIANQIIQELVERLTDAHEMMLRLALEPVEGRIAHTLTRLAHKAGNTRANSVTIEVPLTRQDIAEMAGTTVETTIRVLSRWRKQGIVQMVGGRLVITNPQRLEQIATRRQTLESSL